MRVPDLVEHGVRQRTGTVAADVKRDRIARHAVYEHEDSDGDSEERQDAVEQAANDVGEHWASLTAGNGFTRRWRAAEITSSAARRESTNRARRGTRGRGPSPCSPSRCGAFSKPPI